MDILILIGGFHRRSACSACRSPMRSASPPSSRALWIDLPLEAVMLKTSDGMDDFALLAIPFFILAGGIMAEGGMAARLVNLAKVFVGFLRGGLALVNILASTMFGCISGSSVADTAAIGSVMIPQMIKEGLSAAVRGQRDHRGLAAAAADPALAQRGDLFARRRRHDLGRASVHGRHHPGPAARSVADDACASISRIATTSRRAKWSRSRQALWIALDAIWGLITVFIIIGGILSGIFTPTESAAVACIYSFLVTMFIYRDYKWSELPLLVGRVVRTVGMVMIMIGFSVAFGYMMAIMQIPAKITEFFLTVADDKYTFLLLVNILLLVLGTFMDLAPMLLICTPIFLPVIKTFGIDPVHFGMIMILNLGIGLLTPPVGPTLVVGCVIGKVTMEAVSKSIMIFYIPMLIVLVHGDLHSGAVAVAAEPAARQIARTAIRQNKTPGPQGPGVLHLATGLSELFPRSSLISPAD